MAGLADAATDRVSVAQAPALTSWSICAWIKPAASASFQPIVRVEAGGGTAMVFGLKGLTPSLYSAASTTGINGSALTTGQYAFVCATRNGTAAALYWGTNPGSLSKVTGTVNSSGTPDTWTVWGRSPSDGSEWFSGTVDYLRTWAGTVLTDAEVAAEGASATAIKAGTWGNWPFGDNGSGGVSLSDISGNARHLTAGSTSLTLVADVSLSINASGTAAAQPGISAGSGGIRVSGSGAATAQLVASAGTAAAIVAGSGAAVAGPAVAAGATAVLLQGLAAATAQPATAAGSAGTLVQGSGVAVASPAAAAGDGGALVDGTGAASASPGAGAGAGAVLVTGSGTATAPPATAEGSSGSLELIQGSGAAVAPSASSVGVAAAVIGGDGAASAASAVAAGFGQVIVSMTGTAVAPAAVSSGQPGEAGSLLLQVGESRPVRWLRTGMPEAVVVVVVGADAPANWLSSGDPASA